MSLDSDVLLYVPFTDADASTGADGYVKSGGTHTLTTDVFARAGNAVINTDQTKMDSSSTAAYNPAGANSDGWELDSTISAGLEVGSSSPLSIQFWFYCLNDGSGSSARLLGWDGWHTSGSGIEFETLSTDYDRFIFYEHTGATTNRRSIGDHVLNANAWNHIYWAFQPSGSSYLGINGTVTEASGSYITDFAPTVDLNLLKTPANADDSVKGYVQEFIVKNTVPYTANFTPSTTPLVSSGGSTALIEEGFEGTGTPSGWGTYVGSGGEIDFDNTSNVKEGSLNLKVKSNNYTHAYYDLGAQYGHIILTLARRATSLSNRQDVFLYNSGGNRGSTTGSMQFGAVSGSNQGIKHDSNNIRITMSGSINTNHYIRIEIDVPNDIVKIARSNDGTSFPTSGTNYNESSGNINSAFGGVQYIALGASNKNATQYYDDIKLIRGDI